MCVFSIQMPLASKATNETVHKSEVQQPFPHSNSVPTQMQNKLTHSRGKKSPNQKGNKLPGCAHRSHLPYCTEPFTSKRRFLAPTVKRSDSWCHLGESEVKILRTSSPGSC